MKVISLSASFPPSDKLPKRLNETCACPRLQPNPKTNYTNKLRYGRKKQTWKCKPGRLSDIFKIAVSFVGTSERIAKTCCYNVALLNTGCPQKIFFQGWVCNFEFHYSWTSKRVYYMLKLFPQSYVKEIKSWQGSTVYGKYSACMEVTLFDDSTIVNVNTYKQARSQVSRFGGALYIFRGAISLLLLYV